jgi:hypothetical protein
LADAPWLEKRIDALREYYVWTLRFVLARPFWRRVAVLLPVWLVFATLIILAPSIW